MRSTPITPGLCCFRRALVRYGVLDRCGSVSMLRCQVSSIRSVQAPQRLLIPCSRRRVSTVTLLIAHVCKGFTTIRSRVTTISSGISLIRSEITVVCHARSILK